MSDGFKLEIEYEGHHQWGLYLGGECIKVFDDFDEAADEFEELGGIYPDD